MKTEDYEKAKDLEEARALINMLIHWTIKNDRTSIELKKEIESLLEAFDKELLSRFNKI